ncbi:hypothetical protein D9611_013191 [Ephemerocybe angulata]|uniref:Nephrocystin 3-like N-terminal domain-containing protein n=1 Tax=Ephemerocybe angulata TaxID=980116 RepID=A0A8H5BVC2_9AGAR|nr:hypothetical protein D9611_013191 [Tulosesus angulatus]
MDPLQPRPSMAPSGAPFEQREEPFLRSETAIYREVVVQTETHQLLKTTPSQQTMALQLQNYSTSQEGPSESLSTLPLKDGPSAQPHVDHAKPAGLESAGATTPLAKTSVLQKTADRTSVLSHTTGANFNGPISLTQVGGNIIERARSKAEAAVFASESMTARNGGWSREFLSKIANNVLNDPSRRRYYSQCHLDIKTEIVKQCATWIQGQDFGRLICITGVEGSGKSNIQGTLASLRTQTSSKFFFSTSDQTRNDLSRVAPTIAYQLGNVDRALRENISGIADGDPYVFDALFQDQLDRLLVRPALVHRSTMTVMPPEQWRHAVLIDGLDQCEGNEQQKELIDALKNCVLEHQTPLRVVITARPDSAIQSYLDENDPKIYHIDLDAIIANASAIILSPSPTTMAQFFPVENVPVPKLDRSRSEKKARARTR